MRPGTTNRALVKIEARLYPAAEMKSKLMADRYEPRAGPFLSGDEDARPRPLLPFLLNWTANGANL
jgi:hypothetical protein